VKTIIKGATWFAWALCALVISASLDTVPDAPVVIRRCSIAQTHHGNVCAEPQQNPFPEVVAHTAQTVASGWRAVPQTPESKRSIGTYRSLKQAADSSPPTLL
jgi:hypothetical protein